MRQKKIVSIAGLFIALLCFLQLALPLKTYAADGQLIISVSAMSAEVGDTLTVTLTANGPGGVSAVSDMEFTYDSGKFSFVSCDTDNYSGGEGGKLTARGNKVNVTLKAISAGTCKLLLTGSNGIISDTQESLASMVAAGASISATEQGGSGNGGENGGTAQKSADNSLSALSVSAGELSPAFSGRTLEYTLTVPYETETLDVTATPSNGKAKATITGNQGLLVGENTVSVTVEAENGDKAVYKIKVTRKEQTAGGAPVVDPTQPGGTAPVVDPTQPGGTAPDEGNASKPEDTMTDGDGGTVTKEDMEQRLSRLQEEVSEWEERYREEKSFSRKVMAIMIFIIVVLIILCVNLLISRGRYRDEMDDEEDEDLDDWEENGRRKKKRGLGSRIRERFREMDEEDDWLDEEEDDWLDEEEDDWLDDGEEDTLEDDGDEPEWRRKSQKKPELSGKSKPAARPELSGKSKPAARPELSGKPKPTDRSEKKKEIELIDLDDL